MDERPVGWYRDPEDTRAHRYWNGESWVVVQTESAEPVEVLQQQ